MGTRHLPHTARSCELALRGVGAVQGRPEGAPLAWVLGRPGLGALPPPIARPWGVSPGPATHWLWVRGVWAWRPATYPTARAPASWPCAPWGRHEGARGGRLSPGCGASGSGRSPTPDCPSFGRSAGARNPLAVDAGGVGVGTRHLSHSKRSCELASRAVGAAQERMRGAPLAWLWSVRFWALSHSRPPIFRACGQGALCTGCGCGGCGPGDPPPTSQRALL